MSSDDKKDEEESSEGDGVHQQGTDKRHKRGYWNLENTKDWVEMFEDKEMPARAIAKEIGADEATVSYWLKKHGKEMHQGLHRKDREPPKISAELAKLLTNGPDDVLKLLNERVWGISASESGRKQLNKFCDFVKLDLRVGLTAAAKAVGTDKSMITAWTQGTKQPYLIRATNTALQMSVRPGWKLLSLRLESGGNVQGPWIQVPTTIQSYDNIEDVLRQTKPLSETYERAARFGIARETVEQMRPGMFSYTLEMMVGDSSKMGGLQERFASTNLELALSKKHPENEPLGELMSMCVNSLGIEMHRIKDGEPSGATRQAKDPTGDYRWNSGRSPLLAWIFFVGLGMKPGEKTSNDPVHMDWIFNTPFEFRKRFVQGLADSDGCAREYVVEICSVPNAEFTTKLLHSLGMSTAYTRKEDNKDLRSVVKNAEAARLPIFNEFTNGYRYQQLKRNSRD